MAGERYFHVYTRLSKRGCRQTTSGGTIQGPTPCNRSLIYLHHRYNRPRSKESQHWQTKVCLGTPRGILRSQRANWGRPFNICTREREHDDEVVETETTSRKIILPNRFKDYYIALYDISIKCSYYFFLTEYAHFRICTSTNRPFFLQQTCWVFISPGYSKRSI